MAYTWTAQLVEPLAQLFVDMITAPDGPPDVLGVLGVLPICAFSCVLLVALLEALWRWGTGDKSGGRWLAFAAMKCVVAGTVILDVILAQEVERLLADRFPSRLLMLSYMRGKARAELTRNPWRLFLPRGC
jgi:hypothetical protein